MLVKFVKFVVAELLFNGHLQSLAALGLVYISSLIIYDEKPKLLLLVVSYSMFQFIYLYDRYKHIVSDSKTNIERTKHLRKYFDKIPLILFILGSVVILGNIRADNYYSLTFSLLTMFLGVLYTFYFKYFTRRILMFKNFYVSLVFAFLIFFPSVYNKAPIIYDNRLYLFIIYVFFEALLSQVSLDCKDTKTDRVDKLLTLPVVVGKVRALKIITLANVLGSVCFFVGFTLVGTQFLISLVLVNSLVNLLCFKWIYENQVKGYAISGAKFFLWFLVVSLVTL